jgi:hypothetical protein
MTDGVVLMVVVWLTGVPFLFHWKQMQMQLPSVYLETLANPALVNEDILKLITREKSFCISSVWF